MSVAVLFPHFDHSAVEERYGSWQSQQLLRSGAGVGQFLFYGPDELASDIVEDVELDYVLVVTDPLVLASARLASRLQDLLHRSGASAVVPMSNVAANPRQLRAPLAPYLTLRELQNAVTELENGGDSFETLPWDNSDPAIFLAKRETLRNIDLPLHDALRGLEVAISANDYVHRWTSLRGQIRLDLLERVSTNAKSILEFGCGEAPLGQALKKRQRCRVVGIELDAAAAAVARKRIDTVYRGDVREIVAILDEQFDWIIGGDIVEHLDEPWSFLSELRRITLPGGHLLLSLPNVANASIVNDLLHGRLDYVYMGLTCVGHLRFFTRQTIEEMLAIAGWDVVEITPQDYIPSPGCETLIPALQAANVSFSIDDLRASGYYVIARNR